MPMPITFADIAPRDYTQEMIDKAFPMPAARDKTAVKAEQKQALGSVMPKKIIRFSFPLNEIAGDITGSRLSPEALAAGAVDLGLDAASLYPPTMNAAIPTKFAANAANDAPRIYNENFWKDLGEPYREKREGFKKDIKRKLNAKENELIDLLRPPIPYIEN